MALKFRKQSNEDDHSDVELSQGTKNIVIFGECGVGKSSLINLIAGRKVTDTSSGALGCTLVYRRHLLDLQEHKFAVWDTAGLDEGTQGSVPAEKAEAYLKQLLHALAKHDGIDLLVYCVRGTRVRKALLANYHIFYSAICRKKVPIAVVITGLENQEDNMETWWYHNAPQFTALNMFFDSHACVTTLEPSVENPTLNERREISKAAVTKIIISTCRAQQWKPLERSWMESAYSDIRAILSPKAHTNARLSTVIMCEAYRRDHDGRFIRRRSISFQNPVTVTLTLPPLNFRSPISISNDKSRNKLPFEQGIKSTPHSLYRVYQVSSEGSEEETKRVAVKRGADLLVFCVAMEGSDPDSVKSQWEYFNLTYGGDVSPRIVVVVGASSKSSAEQWWIHVVGELPVKNDVDVAYWPGSAAEDTPDTARRQLQMLINDHCLDCGDMTFARNGGLMLRMLRLDKSNPTPFWGKPENVEEGEVIAPVQDILTKLEVWHDVPELSPSTASPVSPKEMQGYFRFN